MQQLWPLSSRLYTNRLRYHPVSAYLLGSFNAVLTAPLEDATASHA